MILVYPPLAKTCEPPAGLARLTGALRQHGISHAVLDANIEGLLYLAGRAGEGKAAAGDRWTARALRYTARDISSLRIADTYRSIARYRRAVSDLDRALKKSASFGGMTVGLTNAVHSSLSPSRSADILFAADNPELDPFYPYFSCRLTDILEKEKPSVIGFSLTYLSQALTAFSMIGFLRKRFPGLTLVCGGGLVTSWAGRPGWRDPFSGLVDHFVAGPGEAVLLKMAGVGQGQLQRHYTPEYGALPLGDYLSPGTILPYSGSSGCFWGRCSFCPERAEGNRYVPIAPKMAVADISGLTTRMRPSLIHLLDNAISPALLRELIDSPPGIPWYGFVRVCEELADVDYCRKLRRSGCVMLKLGIESGDQSVLDSMQKGIDVETASKALKTLKQAGIASYIYLLFGTPSETIEAARKTLEFTAANADGVTFLNLAIFNMPLGGPGTEEFETRRFYEGDLSLYTDFRHPHGWGRRQVRDFLEHEFRRHPAVSAILRRDPPFFTSNHAPFFLIDRDWAAMSD